MFHFRLRSAAKEDTGRGSHVRTGFNFWRVRGRAMDACPEKQGVPTGRCAERSNKKFSQCTGIKCLLFARLCEGLWDTGRTEARETQKSSSRINHPWSNPGSI